QAPKRGGARSAPTLVVRPEGAAQIALIGPPNSGKSLLHAQLTGSAAKSGPYPFTTQYPEPGMARWEDVAFQLIDLPAISAEHPLPWLGGTLQSTDACLLVVDLSDAGCIEQVAAVQAELALRKVHLTPHWPGTAERPGGDTAGNAPTEIDVFAVCLPTVLVANKADRLERAATDLEALGELEEPHFPTTLVSAQTGQGLGALAGWLWRALGLVRVYTKAPGKPAELQRPFTLRHGEQTVGDVARLVHRDMARTLKYARIWGRSVVAEGQHVGREHVLADRDVVELHV
ncbi:MAG TPA: GTPase, partial [Steroidobacteraceae bacterium]|nr:GTPase [Steroidobacteraceae bacterium]